MICLLKFIMIPVYFNENSSSPYGFGTRPQAWSSHWEQDELAQCLFCTWS
jgi:hypothetical protein